MAVLIPPALPFPLVVCDIGGTHARFRFFAGPNAAPRDLRLGTHDLPSFEDALAAAGGADAASLIVSAAGTVVDGRVDLTYARWRIDARAIAARRGLAACLLLNDFEAQAIALPHLRPEHTHSVAEGAIMPARTRIVLGPGTGFGMAALIPTPFGLLPAASEAGNMSFGPLREEERALFARAARHKPLVTESFVSGPGLALIDQALADDDVSRNPEAVTAAATAGEPRALEAVATFWRLFARAAGDLAMAHVALGGVTLAGGVAARLAPFLDRAAFMRAFADKGMLSSLAAGMNVQLLMEESAVLDGLAALAARPGAYCLDYGARLFGALTPR